MDKKEKNKITNLIIFNTTLIVCLLVLLYYFSQQYIVLWQNIDDANKLYSSYNKLKSDWIDINDLAAVSAKYGSNKEFIVALWDKDKLKWIIQKGNPSADYSTRLSLELSKETQTNNEIKNNETILWNILPIFYQYWDSYSDDNSSSIDYQITLDNFTSFVENNILRKNNIISYSPIWIDNITFDNWDIKKKAKSTSNSSQIWSFVLNLDFSAKNKDIISLIEYIQNSWTLDIQNWKLINKSKINNVSNFSALDNLLMTIDNLTLKDSILAKDIIDAAGKPVLHAWTIKIRFYVRWMWFEQLNNIKTKAVKKLSTLSIDVTNKSKLCDKWNNPICKDWIWSQAVAILRSFLKDINAIQVKVDTKMKIVPNLDINVNQELSDWLSISSSIDTVESSCLKSINYINSQIQKWAK